MPHCFGGLGFPNLRFLNMALQAKWLWLQRTDPLRPWHDLSMGIPQAVVDIFEAGSSVEIVDGKTALFWTDRLHSARIKDLAPNIFAAVPRSDLKISVADALQGYHWTRSLLLLTRTT